MEKFADRLKTIRKNAGMTQEQVANICGISQSNINTWETGRSLPSFDGLVALANCFVCSVDYLLGRESEESIIVINEDLKYTPDEKNLIKSYRKLNSKKKEEVMDFVKFHLS
ncbi:MAG: helix-turn-helix domain-containing protein [Clostridia bacterium]|nr:helix-turn-helix domain-containing protein [Clostridia bacterium]